MNMAEQLILLPEGIWTRIRDGNPTGLAIFDRHYSSRRAHVRKQDQFVGPGSHLVLITEDAKALFIWRKFISDAGEQGVNCAVFRNEGATGARSSDLIRAADELAWEKWPGERHYTYVDPSEIRSTNPGFCFIQAGWSRLPYLTKAGLRVLERVL